MFSQVNNNILKRQNRQNSSDRDRLGHANQITKGSRINSPKPMPTLLSNLFLSFLFLIIFTLFLSGCNTFNPKSGSLEGEVHRETSHSSTPLEGALISISGSTNTTTTDQRGYFLFSDVPSGRRTLTIIKEGYITLKLPNVYIEPNIINKVF